MTRDKRGPALRDFIPGYIAAVQRTPIQTAGNLPGGGRLFEVCTRAVEATGEQLALAELTDEERESLLARAEGDE